MSLKQVLQLNALSSGASGLLMVVLSKTFAAWFGVQAAQPFAFVGIGLVVFAAMVYSVSLQKPIQAGRVWGVIALDVAWVLGSIVLIMVSSISALGTALTAAVALWVGLMAFLQHRGLRAMA
jgi:hypothetical protein